MKTLRLSRRARSDLETIWNYTLAEFGETQAQAYLTELENGMSVLLDYAEIGRSAEHIKIGYRALTKEHHVIYYIVSEHHIDIIGVLHERMDPATQL